MKYRLRKDVIHGAEVRPGTRMTGVGNWLVEDEWIGDELPLEVSSVEEMVAAVKRTGADEASWDEWYERVDDE